MGVEQRLKELDKRRKRGMRLLADGFWPAEVTRCLGVTRQSVLRWTKLKERSGVEALKRPGCFGVELSQPSVWRMLQQLGWSMQRPAERAGERDEPAIRTWYRETVASDKKLAARQGRIIAFIDESGLSERPCRARTLAPKGQTPVLQYSILWRQLSVIAGVSYWRFHFRFFPGPTTSPLIVQFLMALQTTIGKKLLIVWERLKAHCSRLVKHYGEGQSGRIALEHLPVYVPELNPVECILGAI